MLGRLILQHRLLGALALAVIMALGMTGAVAQANGSGDAWPIRLTANAPNTVVGLGDSVMSGAHCGCVPFLNRYAQQLARRQHTRVRSINLGQPGITSTGALAAMQPGRGDVAALAEATIVVVTVGANDFANHPDQLQNGQCGGSQGLACTAATMTTLARNMTAIIGRIHRLRHGRPVTIKVTGYWNIFEDGAVARADYTPGFRRATDLLTRRVNATLRRAAATAGADYVDLYRLFKGPHGDVDDTTLLERDGDHPDTAGHALIADALAAS